VNEEIPDPTYPEGSVIGDFDGQGNPYETPELLHRPHAFALMHGDEGAKIAYGQLLWHVDRLDVRFDPNSPGLSSGTCDGVGQTRAIKGLEAVIPKLDSTTGAVMDPTIPSIYHQLDGYGNVYLYWKVELSDVEYSVVTECWVEVGDTPAPGLGPADIAAVAVANTDHDRFAGTPSEDDGFGVFRVKLGAVNVDENVTQNISSDVYWSAVVLTREQGS